MTLLPTLKARLRRGHRLAPRPGGAHSFGAPPPCTLTVADGHVTAATGPLPGAVPPMGPADLTGRPVAAVLAGAGGDPELADRVAALEAQGTAFVTHAAPGGGALLCVAGRTEGACARLDLRPAGPAERALHDRLADAVAEVEAGRHAARRAEAAPLPALELDAAGAIVWSNPAAAELIRAVGGGPRLARLAAEAEGPRRLAPGLGWVHVTAVPSGDGRLIFMQDIDAQRRAESALGSFTATLTETFAHLDIALAVFDQRRRLNLFNPALPRLFRLDPAPLAAQPSLRGFLDALRRNRMIPEPHDFQQWRQSLLERLEAAESALQEDWVLPSGQVLRVIARPHPRGALALVFEDISGVVSLERRYREELALGQATLDLLDQGVAVFGRSGEVLMTNAAFEAALGFDDFAGLVSGGIERVIAAAAEAAIDGEVWHAFRRYALSAERPERWEGIAHPHGGGRLLLKGGALPDGSTLLTLSGPALAVAVRAAGSGGGAGGRRIGCAG